MIYNSQISQLLFPHLAATHFHNILVYLVCNVKVHVVILLHLLLLLSQSIFKLRLEKNTILSDFIAILSFEDMGLPPFQALGNSEVQMQAKIFESDVFEIQDVCQRNSDR